MTLHSVPRLLADVVLIVRVSLEQIVSRLSRNEAAHLGQPEFDETGGAESERRSRTHNQSAEGVYVRYPKMGCSSFIVGSMIIGTTSSMDSFNSQVLYYLQVKIQRNRPVLHAGSSC
jgi:hypothetical protein